jgi:hypothetical protein
MSESSDERWLGRYVMKLSMVAVGAGLVGLTACGTTSVTVMQTPAAHSAASASRGATKAVAPTKTVVKYRTIVATPSTAPSTTAAPPAAPAPAAPQQPADQNVTDPWAVVSAYYGDVESGNFRQAWRLIGSGSTTGQTYQQFVDGYACTGSQDLSEVGESGNTVTFNLTATDSCTGQVQHYSGTDTVQNGTIVADNVQLDR